MEQAVIFDFDGVLINTGEYHRLAWVDVSAKENLKYSDDFFYETFGMQNYQVIPMMADKKYSDEKIEEISQWKEARFRELITGGIETLEGVLDLLDALKEAGFRLAVGSSTLRVNLDFLLDKAGLENKFEKIIAGEDAQNGKPAPDTFLAAAKKLNVDPANCVVVEDAIPGVQAAKAAGMKVIAITTTRKREQLTMADLIIDSMTELSPGDFANLLNETMV